MTAITDHATQVNCTTRTGKEVHRAFSRYSAYTICGAALVGSAIRNQTDAPISCKRCADIIEKSKHEAAKKEETMPTITSESTPHWIEMDRRLTPGEVEDAKAKIQRLLDAHSEIDSHQSDPFAVAYLAEMAREAEILHDRMMLDRLILHLHTQAWRSIAHSIRAGFSKASGVLAAQGKAQALHDLAEWFEGLAKYGELDRHAPSLKWQVS